MHRNVQALFRRHAAGLFTGDRRVLEIGPDRAPSTLQTLVDYPDDAWHTLDLVSRDDVALTYRAEAEYAYPVTDDAYDIVVASSVLEHVPRIWVWIRELVRICRPGGHVVIISPVSWHYHEAPVDCWRMYPEGARALFEDAGLELVLSEFGAVDLEWLQRLTPARLRRKAFWQRFSGLFGLWNALTRLPPEGAFDTISIGRKPPEGP
jgi:SAM-dependent methyltransferase